MEIQPIILCGGSGTRLWPISTTEIPKQFIPLSKDNTLLQQTINRIKKLDVLKPLLIMNKNHKLETNLDVIYEEYANDTSVAVARACLYIKNKNPNKNIIIIVFPADHYIHNDDNFIIDIKSGINHVTISNIVLYGIKPTSPETKYGYIIPNSSHINFIEKPDINIASDLIKQNALWNSGIFASHIDLILKCIHESSYNIMDYISNPREGKIASFDVAILQNHKNIYAQIVNNWKWSDVGTWNSFTEIPSIKNEITYPVNVNMSGCTNVEILNRSDGRIIIINCKDLFIAKNGSDILIMSNTTNNDNQLKNIVNNLF